MRATPSSVSFSTALSERAPGWAIHTVTMGAATDVDLLHELEPAGRRPAPGARGRRRRPRKYRRPACAARAPGDAGRPATSWRRRRRPRCGEEPVRVPASPRRAPPPPSRRPRPAATRRAVWSASQPRGQDHARAGRRARAAGGAGPARGSRARAAPAAADRSGRPPGRPRRSTPFRAAFSAVAPTASGSRSNAANRPEPELRRRRSRARPTRTRGRARPRLEPAEQLERGPGRAVGARCRTRAPGSITTAISSGSNHGGPIHSRPTRTGR